MRILSPDVREFNQESGALISSLTARLLEQHNAKGGSLEDEEDIKSVAATSFAAGADTVGISPMTLRRLNLQESNNQTASPLGTFTYAMLLNPDAQKKAQAEIDIVIGSGRIPGYEDRGSLPYVEALYREVMRWRPATPLSLPRATSAYEVYDGNYIPKGLWHMMNRYTRALTCFFLSVSLDEDGQLNDDDFILTFGFGRR
ncbi:hypothetical protein H0H81_004540 [Sphagnurus paluster]|uniref:Uncharacterized protein n=1 Tax=Sphagnurus paluster TaxID=117069 RepID=A0A9P7GNL7_9AGAR|nr:hypothetical protein H0H81_004540 [Sphagnurus paluster]